MTARLRGRQIIADGIVGAPGLRHSSLPACCGSTPTATRHEHSPLTSAGSAATACLKCSCRCKPLPLSTAACTARLTESTWACVRSPCLALALPGPETAGPAPAAEEAAPCPEPAASDATMGPKLLASPSVAASAAGTRRRAMPAARGRAAQAPAVAAGASAAGSCPGSSCCSGIGRWPQVTHRNRWPKHDAGQVIPWATCCTNKAKAGP